MRNLSLVVFLAVGFVVSAALAQKAITFQPSDTVIMEVMLARIPDGGVAITVVGENTAGDVTLQRSRTCEVTSLTTAQKTALATVRNAALACWNSQEGL